ncbi:MAG: tRNA pseudouridine(13) synthase TruD [Gammaproteobacteria bacterium]|jgi:tRNA pseudouridine13 synthase|nr:tRNA pseudouridine(13) synthase TruD [Gammaproteobacteria bacterium]
MNLPAWARVHGAPLFRAIIRATPEEFDVSEELGYEFDGNGEHDFLYVEKVGTNTEWLSRQLADFADVPARDVGYSGLKDRHAVTRQWFSVPRWHSPDWSLVDIAGASILEQARHSKKLRRGAHKSNRFKIVLRGKLPDSGLLKERIRMIAMMGVPNYYGEQRFGHEGGNIQLANDWAAGKRLPRHKRSIAISSARSFLFNERLNEKALDGSWNHLTSGDLANLDGTGSIFSVDDVDSEIERRCAEMDIHPAEELACGGSQCGHEAWQNAFDKARVKPASRSLRLRVIDLQMEIGNQRAKLCFKLGRGAFATSVLREIADY